MTTIPHNDKLDTVGRFSDRAADYVKYRPTYPPDAIDAVLEALGPPERLIAADVGAGTGISARTLGDRGVSVIAVEPGEAMRRSAAPHLKVAWVAGRAERTGLRAHAVDLVLCAQSFHWFQTAETVVEFARILKDHGWLALVWNRRSAADPLTAGYRQAILDAGGETAHERMPFDREVIVGSGLFSPPTRASFPNSQRLERDGFIGRAHSASYVPKAGPAGDTLIRTLRSLYERYADAAGFVTLVYETEVYRSRKL